jgi:hypothetical protein
MIDIARRRYFFIVDQHTVTAPQVLKLDGIGRYDKKSVFSTHERIVER